MASLQATEQETRAAIAELPEELRSGVELAALNTPTQTVVSGDAAAVDALVAQIAAMGREATRLLRQAGVEIPIVAVTGEESAKFLASASGQ